MTASWWIFATRSGRVLPFAGFAAVSDFENEFQMAWTNHRLNSAVETVFLFATESNHFVSSRMAKEVARLGGALDAFVPPPVAEALRQKNAVKAILLKVILLKVILLKVILKPR